MSDSYDVVVIGSGLCWLCLCHQVCTTWFEHRGRRIVGRSKGKTGIWRHLFNAGCIPSKALLDSSHKFTEARDHFSVHGIDVGAPAIDVAGMMKRKDKIVTQLTGGVSLHCYSTTGSLSCKEKASYFRGVTLRPRSRW